jgi:hypothetical protein
MTGIGLVLENGLRPGGVLEFGNMLGNFRQEIVGDLCRLEPRLRLDIFCGEEIETSPVGVPPEFWRLAIRQILSNKISLYVVSF